jgi:hypothetical protein
MTSRRPSTGTTTTSRSRRFILRPLRRFAKAETSCFPGPLRAPIPWVVRREIACFPRGLVGASNPCTPGIDLA